MSDDVIGRGVIEVSADTSKVSAGIETAKRSVRSLGGETGTALSEGANKGAKAIDAYIKKLQQSADMLGKSTREVKLFELAQRGATEAQLKAADAALSQIEAYKLQQQEARKAAETNRAGAVIAAAAQASQATAMKLTAFQTQQLSFQLNDLFVQLAGGQSPITALIQQGSQLNGTFGGIGGTMRALGTLVTGARVAVGGLTGVVTGLAYAAIQGQRESDELRKSLVLTGNAAGITAGQFEKMAAAVADGTKSSSADSRDVLQQLVSSGRFTGDALSATAKATLTLSKATGQSTDEIVKQFIGMTDGVAKFGEQANRTYHFLSAAQLEQIKNLEEQGESQKAIVALMDAFNARARDSVQNLGYLETAWKEVGTAIKNAWDALKGFGRDNPEAEIAAMKDQIALLEKSRNPADRRLADQMKEELAFRLAQNAALQQGAKAQGEMNDREQARTKFNALLEQSMTRQQKLAKELANANAWADKAQASPAERKSVIDGIKEKYKDLDLGKSTLGLRIEQIQSDVERMTGLYQNAESILEATRAAGLLNEKEYYEAKQSFIRLNLEAQVKGLQDQNALLAASDKTEKERLENQKKITENQAKIERLQNDASSKGVVLGLQQEGAINQVTRAYAEARVAAQDYLDTLTRQQVRDLNAFDKSDAERARIAARQQIEDRYTAQLLELENGKRIIEGVRQMTDDERKKYEDRKAIILEFQEKALKGWDDYYKAIREKQGNWENGSNKAIANYLDRTRNVAAQSEQFFTNAFQGMEDGLTKFAMTGKLAFSDFANSVISDLIRIQLRQSVVAPLAQGLSGSSVANFLGALFGGKSSTAGSGPAAGINEFGSATHSAAGGFDIPSGVNPVTQLHQREMVLPAEYADVIRGMAAGGAASAIKVEVVNQTGVPAQATANVRSDGTLEVMLTQIEGRIAQNVGGGVGPLSRVLASQYGIRRKV